MDHSLEPQNAVNNSVISMGPYTAQPSRRPGCSNLLSTVALKRYIERALERVLEGRTNVHPHDCGMILDRLRESCVVDIMKREFPSKLCCTIGNDAVEETIVTIEEDSALKADIKKSEIIKDNSQGNNNSQFSEPQLRHAPLPRKDVPAEVLYSLRGVQCSLCRQLFKGPDCLECLIEHTKEKHLDKASPRFLKRVMEENSYKNLLGDGIMYCTCSMCIRIGFARLDKRYDVARRMCL